MSQPRDTLDSRAYINNMNRWRERGDTPKKRPYTIVALSLRWGAVKEVAGRYAPFPLRLCGLMLGQVASNFTEEVW